MRVGSRNAKRRAPHGRTHCGTQPNSPILAHSQPTTPQIGVGPIHRQPGTTQLNSVKFQPPTRSESIQSSPALPQPQPTTPLVGVDPIQRKKRPTSSHPSPVPALALHQPEPRVCPILAQSRPESRVGPIQPHTETSVGPIQPIPSQPELLPNPQHAIPEWVPSSPS